MFGTIGQAIRMPQDLAEELRAAAARHGTSPGQLLRAAVQLADDVGGLDLALDATRRSSGARPPRAAARAAPRRSVAPAPRAARVAPPEPLMEFCDTCDRQIGGPPVSRCKCYDPPAAVSPGASPLALEAEGVHPSGIAVAMKLARAPFAPYELSLARNSVAQHGGAGVVHLQGGIDGGSAFHVCRMLDASRAAGAKAIVLDITSEGGSVPAGLAIVRAVERLRAAHVPTIASVRHHANSMASVITVSCDYAVLAPAATMSIHEAQGGRDDHLAILRAKLLDTYEARTLMDRAQLAGYLSGAVSLDAQAARSHGFCDEVAGPERLEELARGVAGPAGLYAGPIAAANSWRRTVLRERQADAEGVTRYGPRQTGRGL